MFINKMSDSDDDEIQRKPVKITVVGEPSTGKSSLCSRYIGGNAVSNGSTQGAEVLAGQCIGLQPAIPLQLCDVSGNALNSHMLGNYLYASDAILLVYDLTNLQSFEKLREWLTKIKSIVEFESKKPLMALFGNKSDLEHQRAVRLSSVQKFASEYLLETFKGSARTGEMVNIAFTNVVARILGFKVHYAHNATNGKSPLSKELEMNRLTHSPLPLHCEPTQSLIMNRKALRKASSKVCTVQ